MRITKEEAIEKLYATFPHIHDADPFHICAAKPHEEVLMKSFRLDLALTLWLDLMSFTFFCQLPETYPHKTLIGKIAELANRKIRQHVNEQNELLKQDKFNPGDISDQELRDLFEGGIVVPLAPILMEHGCPLFRFSVFVRRELNHDIEIGNVIGAESLIYSRK
jgi:hypothetical protein